MGENLSRLTLIFSRPTILVFFYNNNPSIGNTWPFLPPNIVTAVKTQPDLQIKFQGYLQTSGDPLYNMIPSSSPRIYPTIGVSTP
jgi:hypothetical protein